VPHGRSDVTPLHLFLLAGQSNMAGRGLLPSGSLPDPDPRIQMLKEDLTWTIARDPLHFDRPGAGVGPGLSFARCILEQRPDWTIGLVPTAVGASPLDDWQPNAPLLIESLRRAHHAQRSGKFEGVLWHQGERDSRAMGKAETYADRLAKTITAFREGIGDPDLPFLAGEIAAFLAEQTDPGFPGLDLVNTAIRKLPDRIPNTGRVSADGLTHIGDQVHLDTASQIRFGRRYADAFRQIPRRESTR